MARKAAQGDRPSAGHDPPRPYRPLRRQSIELERLIPARRHGWLLWLLAGIGVVAVLVALIAFTRPTTRGSTGQTASGATRPPGTNRQDAGAPVGFRVGDRAPDFTLQDLQGKQVSLHNYQGRPVLLHFWAVDCTNCQAEQPDYLRAIRDLGKAAPAILAVDAWGESASYAAPYVLKAHLPGTVLVDPAKTVFYGLYAGEGTPTTVYIDKEGIIRQSVIGQESYDQIVANARLITA